MGDSDDREFENLMIGRSLDKGGVEMKSNFELPTDVICEFVVNFVREATSVDKMQTALRKFVVGETCVFKEIHIDFPDKVHNKLHTFDYKTL